MKKMTFFLILSLRDVTLKEIFTKVHIVQQIDVKIYTIVKLNLQLADEMLCLKPKRKTKITMQ